MAAKWANSSSFMLEFGVAVDFVAGIGVNSCGKTLEDCWQKL
jgi:hypothetical protein